MVKVSVIVPVYNTRDYIVTCMESLMNQTLDDIEVIFVDDHGSDDSISVVRNCMDAYTGPKKFRIIETSSNSGPGVARNLGIENAEGEYVAFVDSDDWVEVTFCESLYKAAVKKKADLAFCDISLDNVSDAESRVATNPRVQDGEFTDKKKAWYVTRFVSYFSTYIYRKEFLHANGLWFSETRSAEDSYFLTCSILAAGRVASVTKPLYHYMVRSSSLSTRLDPLRYQQKMTSFNHLLEYAKRHDLYDRYKAELDFIYVKKGFLASAFTYVKNASKRDSRVLSSLHDELLRNAPDYMNGRYYRKSVKVRTLTWLIRRWPRLAGMAISSYVRKSGRMV